MASDQRQTIRDVPIFQADKFAADWDEDGNPTEFLEFSSADLDAMVRNHQHIVESGQPTPFLKPGHDGDGVLGFVENLRRKGKKLYADLTQVPAKFAEMIRQGLIPWRSVEIVANGEAVNYRGTDGPVLKALAALSTHPRVKTLDSSDYGETALSFADRAAGGEVTLTTFQEADMAEDNAAKPAEFQEDPPKKDEEEAVSASDLRAFMADIDERLKKLEGTNAQDEEEDSPKDADAQEPKPKPPGENNEKPEERAAAQAINKATASDDAVEMLRSRTERAEGALSRVLTAKREEAIASFADEIRGTHGQADAERAESYVRKHAGEVDVLECFSEDGSDPLASAISDARDLLGPRKIFRAAEAVSRSTAGRVTGGDDTSDEAIREAIFAETEEVNPWQAKWLRSPEGENVLNRLVESRKKAREEA